MWTYHNENIIGKQSNKVSHNQDQCFDNLWVEKALDEDIDPDDKVTKRLIKEVLGNYSDLTNEGKDQWSTEKIPNNDLNSSQYQD